MKKFLSLVLALVMTMSLVTISAGAKEFTDDADINYDEAVAVISEIGVVDGYADGKFNPTSGLTRGAAAKIICNLILGPTTAAELHADTAPYPDVPLSNTFSGYIAYCAKEGIISGYADGTFKPAAPLTGYAFMKMLLGALGYDSTYEGFTGANWSVNVAKQAIGIGLNAGLKDEFNGVDYVTREEAALYAFNTLKATMVDYDNKITANVNGAEVTISNTSAKPVTWSEGRNNDGNIKMDGFVQFAEEFFPKLTRKDDSDDFMRPANNWIYDKTDIGTFARYDLLVETYTSEVTGKDIYDLLKSGVISDNDLESYVDGTDNTIKKTDLVRSNNKKLANTGDGVVTEVYLDTDKDLITIVSINTYLAKATADYSESKEYAPLNVYVSNATGSNYNVDVEQVANIVDVKADTFYQVNITKKYNTSSGEVAVVAPVEVLENSTVTKFSTSAGSDTTSSKVTKLTTGGTEYKANVKAIYDDAVLDLYNDGLLTSNTYNVYVDANGYFLGVDLFEGTKNYVFITGYDLGTSYISVKTADAAAIFLDGTMKGIKVDVKATQDNIAASQTEKKDGYKYFTSSFDSADKNANVENNWYTYTVDADGVYTLKPAVRSTKTVSTTSKDGVIRTDNLVVDANQEGYTTRVYGEDATVFLTVDTGAVSDGTVKVGITEVTGVYTGVQNVDIEADLSKDNQGSNMGGHIFTVYDSDYYVIGAVVLGDAIGSTQNLAYILTGAKSESKVGDTYYWEFDAIMNGEIKTFTAQSKYSNTILALKKDTVQELRFNGDYVTAIKPLNSTDFYTDNTQAIEKQSVYKMDPLTADKTTLNLQGRTMYITAGRDDYGLALAKDAKAVTIQTENGSVKKTEFSSVGAALSHLADAKPDVAGDSKTLGLQFAGKIYAVLNDNATASWVLFYSDTALNTGATTPVTKDAEVVLDLTGGATTIRFYGTANKPTESEAVAMIEAKLAKEGYTVTNRTYDGSKYTWKVANAAGFTLSKDITFTYSSGLKQLFKVTYSARTTSGGAVDTNWIVSGPAYVANGDTITVSISHSGWTSGNRYVTLEGAATSAKSGALTPTGTSATVNVTLTSASEGVVYVVIENA